jgi:hypothetical protein
MRRRSGGRLEIRPVPVGNLLDGRNDPGFSFGRDVVSICEGIHLGFNILPEDMIAFEKGQFVDLGFDQRLQEKYRADQKHNDRGRNPAQFYEKDFKLE